MMQVSRRGFRTAVALMLSACGGTNPLPADGSTGDGSSGDAGPIEVVDGRSTFPGCSDAFGASSEGTPGSPVRIPFGDAPHTGGVDPDQGSSYYRITGLVPGNRYTVTITGDLGVRLSLFQSDAGYSGFPACKFENTSSTGGYACKIVAQGDSFDVEVFPRIVHPDGRCFTLDVAVDSPAGAFEGAFDDLMTLPYGTPALPHRGIVDHERSYYRITGLTPGRRYTVWMTGIEAEVNLVVGTEDEEGGVRNVGCPLGNLGERGTADESCTVVAESDALALEIWHYGSVVSSKYVLSVFEDPSSVGALGSPVVLNYDRGIEHVASVGPAQGVSEPGLSFYEIRGMTSGVQYQVSITDALGLRVHLYSDASFTSALACNNIDTRFYCALVAPATGVFLSIANSAVRGRILTLHAREAPVDEGSFSSPKSLTYPTDFPYRGAVAWTSEYLVSGVPAGLVSVTLIDADGPVGYSAWAADSSVIDCSAGVATFPRCALTASTAGEMRIRASGYGHFDLDLAPAPVLLSDPVREVSTQAIPNGDPAGLSRTLTVTASAVTSIEAVTVELFIDHGRPIEVTASLVAPDGTTEIQLTGKGGGPYEGVVFDDYALEPLSGLRRDGALQMRPVTPLHVLSGMDANGTWTLRVVDDEDPNIQGNDGALLGWGLTFR